jgi:hypothetical protein
VLVDNDVGASGYSRKPRPLYAQPPVDGERAGTPVRLVGPRIQLELRGRASPD